MYIVTNGQVGGWSIRIPSATAPHFSFFYFSERRPVDIDVLKIVAFDLHESCTRVVTRIPSLVKRILVSLGNPHLIGIALSSAISLNILGC